MRSLFRVLRYLRPYRILAVLALLSGILTTLFELIPPWLMKGIIDDVIREGRIEWLKWFIIALIASFLLRSLLNFARIRFNNALEQRVIYDMRQDVYRSLQGLSVSYFENHSTGEVMSRVVNDVNNLESLFIDGVEAMVMACFTLIGILIVMMTMNWKLALIALLPIPILISGGLIFTTKAHQIYRLIHTRSGRLNALIQDNLSGIREIMSFNRQGHEFKRFSRLNRDFCHANLKAMRLWSVYSPGMIFVASWGLVMTLWFGSQDIMAGQMTIGELVAFTGYLALFYTPINQIHTINRMVQHALAAGDRIFEILDAKPDIVDLPDAITPSGRSSGRVRFERVSFRYHPDLPVIQGVSFEAQSGNRIALVGPSGAGKSTLMKLLMRFHDVDEGSIALDDHDIRTLRLEYLRAQIGFVQQEPFLFNGTIRENILYGKPDFDLELIRRIEASQFDDEVMEAAKGARAHEFIEELPETYDTWIGERGVKLSVGQKQRVAIARSLIKDPPIIIFDEATSNIDSQTDLKIQQALETLTEGRTTFIIAHRLSTLRNVDQILVVVNGQLVEQGSHDQLLSMKGPYAALYGAQFAL